MVSTVNEAFHKYRESIEPNEKDLEKIKKAIRKLELFLRNNIPSKFRPIYIHRSGSFKRKTATKSLDIDLLFVFSNDIEHLSPRDLLHDIAEAFSRAERKAKAKTHAIELQWSKTIFIDIVPAFEKNGVYKLPEVIDNRSRWVKSDPRRNEEILKEANETMDKKLIPLIRIMKSWNKQKPCSFFSFHLETIILALVKKGKLSADMPLSEMVAITFQYLGTYVNRPIEEPAKVGPVLEVRESQRECLTNRIRIGFQIAQKARVLEKEGKQLQAINKWGEVLGAPFPRSYP